MKMTMMPIVVSALGTVSKDLEKGLEKSEKTRSIETISLNSQNNTGEKTCCHSDSCERPPITRQK